MKTIAQQLYIKKFPFSIKDDDENEIYYEDSGGYWQKWQYNSNGNPIYFEDSDGVIAERQYDAPQIPTNDA
jgi:hypothetical protein